MRRRSRLERRSFLSGVVGGVCGLSGCAGTIGVGGSPPTDRQPPDRPTEFTPDSLAAYVADYEAARVHNRYVADGADGVHVEAAATFDYRADDGYHLTAQHTGTVSYDDGGRDVDAPDSAPVPYRVTDESTRRASVERRTVVDEGRDAAGEPADPPLGVRLPNFTDRPRELTVVAVSDAGDGDRVGSVTVEVEPGTATLLRSMALLSGTYRVIARFEENGITGEGRVDVTLPGVDRAMDVDVLSTPDGLSTRLLPSLERA